jgi:hypothetical protein
MGGPLDPAHLGRGPRDAQPRASECCVTKGVLIAWPEACVAFSVLSVQEDGSKLRGISFDELVRGARDLRRVCYAAVDAGITYQT